MNCGKPCECPSYREHLLSVGFSSKAMPTRASAASRQASKLEERWEKDMPAYRRLRDDNLKPQHIDGSAEMEARANDAIEVNSGHLYGDKLPIVKEIHGLLQEKKAS